MSTTSTLQTALLAFQSAAPVLPKDATNPHFRSKYTPLDTIVETVGPLLTEHGLTWSTFPTRDEHGPALRYVLGHAASGETVEGTMPLLLTKSDPQGQGSAITYARRYAMCAVLNLVADEDDDGNAAGARDEAPVRRRKAPVKSKGKGKADDAPAEAAPADDAKPARAKLSQAKRKELVDLYRAAGWDQQTLCLQLVAVDALTSGAVEALGDSPDAKAYADVITPAMSGLSQEQYEMIKKALEDEVSRRGE